VRLPIVYAILALIAMAANFCTQEWVLFVYLGAFSHEIALVLATAVGLLVKYPLDKRYIFRFKAQNAVQDTKIFMLYGVMAVLTTVIFWGFEYGFDHYFKTKIMRYTGGAIGLIIGYVVKYHLDKRYVFRM
jgi:putative flippase GtrA